MRRAIRNRYYHSFDSYSGGMLARKTLTSYHLCFDTFRLSDRPGSRVEVAKTLDNILILLEQIKRFIEKSHGTYLNVHTRSQS